MGQELTGRVALVTGARRNIGAAIARRLAAAGASVVLAAQTQADEGFAEMLESLGSKAAAVAFDLADASARADAIARASAPFGPIDILINNAAANNYEPASRMDLAYRRMMFDINVHGPMDLVQQALPHLREQKWGRIINITSGSVHPPEPPYRDSQPKIAVYGASKLALERFSTGLAVELHGTGVTVNSFYPTAVAVSATLSDIGRAALRNSPEAAESVEMMAEAAMLLVTGQLTGVAMASREILFMLQAPLHAADGEAVIGDANTLATLEG